MKTYTKTTQEPCLEIGYDNFADNPRKDNYNLGYFITMDNSPDDEPTIQKIVENTGNESVSLADHIRLIMELMAAEGHKVIAIYPVTKYEHGGISYSLGTKHGFDYSNNGFYIVTELTADRIDATPKDFEDIIKSELETYNDYVNGEVYYITLRDEDGEIIEECGNLYGLESVRDGLPKEYKNEDLTKYIIK